MTKPLRVLLVEDSAADAKLIFRELRRHHEELYVERVEDATGMRAALGAQTWDVILSDWSLPKFSGAGALGLVKLLEIDLPFIIVSGTVGETIAVAAMRAGAHDYVLKDQLARLPPAIERELREHAMRVERRVVEAALHASETRFARLSESGIIGIARVDTHGTFKDANAAFLRIIGRCHDDLDAGHISWKAITATDWLAFDDDALAQLRNTGILALRETEYLRPDSTRVPVLVGGSLVDRDGGECIVFAADLTDQKRAEADARRREQKYLRLFETAQLGICMLGPDSRIVLANSRIEELLGHGRLLGRSLFELMDDEGRALATSLLERRRRGIREQFEFKFKRGDGVEVWTLIEASPIFDDAGAYDGALAMVMDITARRRTEEALRHSQEQLRQTQKLDAIGSLAAGIAHDFNNVLSVVLTCGAMVLEDLEAGHPLQQDVQQIVDAGQRAARLTRQLLAFGRRQVLEPQILNLNKLITDVESMLRRLVPADVVLVLKTSASLANVLVDPSQIEQVIINLVVNARDAISGKGEIRIETTTRTIEAGTFVVLSVTDTGSGMDEATRSRIFEPFFTTKDLGAGTGLGLSTVFGIVKQSGGSISVDSEPGRGTTFTVYLPRTVESGASITTSIPIIDDDRGSETILLVEDDDQVRAVARTLLQRHGYDVLEASNAGEAFLVFESAPDKIQLLLTDVVMPRMTGIQLADRLQLVRPKLRVLYMTGYPDRWGLEAALLLVKPITPSVLLRKVREVLEAAR